MAGTIAKTDLPTDPKELRAALNAMLKPLVDRMHPRSSRLFANTPVRGAIGSARYDRYVRDRIRRASSALLLTEPRGERPSAALTVKWRGSRARALAIANRAARPNVIPLVQK
jgi:hypothetical protein